MSGLTGISWCDSTFNPWWGCEKVSPACDHCYAESGANRYGFKIWGQDVGRRLFAEEHFIPPLRWGKVEGRRRRVFTGSYCDVMEKRDDLIEPRERLYDLIEDTAADCDWLMLTKRPQNFVDLLPSNWLADMPFNIWGMTTVENQDYWPRMVELALIPFKIRGISVEPMLGPLKLGPLAVALHWVIVGAESGHGARETKLEWVRALRDECKQNRIKFFVKQLVIDGKLTKDVRKFPEDLRIQEFPA